jgi:hypothetical protein
MSQPSCYGLYSIGLDRFILHSAIDHWSLLDTAKILSSKFATVLCFSTQMPFPFKGIDCLKWSLKNKNIALSRAQTPTIYHISSDLEIQKTELPKASESHSLQIDFAFSNYIFKCVLAARLVDLNLSLNHSVHNDDQKFYLNLMPNVENCSTLIARKEQTVWEKGFLNTIYSILYLSESEIEIQTKIKKLFTHIGSLNNTAAQKISLLYLNTYLEYVNEPL